MVKRSCAYVRNNHEWECINAIRKLKSGLLRLPEP